MTAPSSDAGAKKPRLVIKKMLLENFKSYAGAQHVGPFHKVRAMPTTSPLVLADAASYRDSEGSRYRPDAPRTDASRPGSRAAPRTRPPP